MGIILHNSLMTEKSFPEDCYTFKKYFTDSITP